MTQANETICFPVKLAVELGDANLAMLVQFFVNTISYHKRLKRNFKDGRTWNYCTRVELAAHFPFLSPDQIKRLLIKLVKLKILRVANYNRKKGDKTNWYSFEDEVKWGIADLNKEKIKSGEIAQGSGEIAQALPLSYHSDNKDNVLDNEKTPTFSKKKEDAEKKPLPSNPIRSRYPLKKDQQPIFHALKSLLTDCDDDTLHYLIRKEYKEHPKEFVCAMRHTKKEVEKGDKFKKGRTAFFRYTLKNRTFSSDIAFENILYAKKFCKERKYDDLIIKEKYVKCRRTGREISTDISRKEFIEYLFKLYED